MSEHRRRSCGPAPVIPVLVIDDAATARPLAEALVAGGLRVLEVTLRTAAALDAIARDEEGARRDRRRGHGGQHRAVRAGDGRRRRVHRLARPDRARSAQPIIDSGVPFLPGIANAGDIMRGLDLGLTHFKFFPAETSGGLKALKALAAPFYQCRFCPTGGITEATAPDWLAFDPVLCVGGSWITRRDDGRGRSEGARGGGAAPLRASAACALARAFAPRRG